MLHSFQFASQSLFQSLGVVTSFNEIIRLQIQAKYQYQENVSSQGDLSLRSYAIRADLGNETLLLHNERNSLSLFGHLVRRPPYCLSLEGVMGTNDWEETLGVKHTGKSKIFLYMGTKGEALVFCVQCVVGHCLTLPSWLDLYNSHIIIIFLFKYYLFSNVCFFI